VDTHKTFKTLARQGFRRFTPSFNRTVGAEDRFLARARDLGVDALVKQDENDAWGFFHATGDLLVTGPTRTNINDFRAIVVL
jgi:glycerate-2-kinase